MTFLFFLLRLLDPTIAFAQAPQLGNTISLVSIGAGWISVLMPIFGGPGAAGSIEGISAAIVASVWSVLIPVGVFLVVRSGFSLIISQDEGKLATAKRTITGTLVGIMLVYTSQRLVSVFYLNGGITSDANASGLQQIIYGIANWSLVTVAALGILMIVVSVIRALASFGKEEGVTNMRQTITGVATGILMISLLPAVKLTLGIVDLNELGGNSGPRPNAGQIILSITAIVAKLMTYLTFLGVVVVIYAGIRMIVNLGNEEEYKKSRTLIGRVLLGLLVILLSYAAVAAVLSIATGGGGVS